MTQMSREYGTALYMLAMESGKEKEYEKALDSVSTAFEENSEYMDFLSSPSIPVAERITAIEQAFSSYVPEHIVSFLQLLCEKGRIQSFFGCVSEYKKLLEAAEHISTAKVVSAVKLTENEKEALKQKLEKISGNTVILECTTDETLLGGMIIETDGKIIDGSLRRKLQEVKEVINK